METIDLRVTSAVDSGGGDSSSRVSSEHELSDVGLQDSPDSEELCSTDVGNTRLGWAGQKGHGGGGGHHIIEEGPWLN